MASRRTLAWRLTVLGLAQLVVLGVTVFWVGYLLRPERPPGGAPPGAPLGAPPGSPPDAPPGALHGPPGPRGRPPHRGPVPLAPLVTFLVSGLVIVGIGSYLTARWIVRPLDTLSRTARALGAGDLRARTAMKRTDEIGDVGRAFDEMADRVQRLLVTERELLANVSHELRTPLARIRVALDLASETGAQGDRQSLAEIHVDLSEIEALIEDIFTATRLDIEGDRAAQPGLPLHKDDVTPEALCARAADRFRSRHPSRPLDLHVEPELGTIHADPVLLRRVLENLLENADKYSPDPQTPVALRARARDGGVEVEVADQGMGIQPEDLPHVFMPFFRGERSRSRGTGGVGLGLTLAKRIVEAHAGTIEVTSAPGAGTVVRVFVPRPS